MKRKTLLQQVEEIHQLEFIPEIGLKYRLSEQRKKYLGPDYDFKDVLLPFFDPDTIDLQEEFIALFLDSGNLPIGVKRMFSGSKTMTIADHTLVFQMAMLLAAEKIVLAHNHPGEDSFPSALDIELLMGFVMKGKILGVPVIDMYIFAGQGKVTSMAELGYLPEDYFQ